jgi:hypothetical protein
MLIEQLLGQRHAFIADARHWAQYQLDSMRLGFAAERTFEFLGSHLYLLFREFIQQPQSILRPTIADPSRQPPSLGYSAASDAPARNCNARSAARPMPSGSPVSLKTHSSGA